MKCAWALGLLLALAPLGCAHRTGALTPGGSPGAVCAAGAPGSGAPREAAPVVDDIAAEAALEAEAAPSAPVADPLVSWNRAMFTFNDKFYFWVLKPVSRAYRTVVPVLARTGVENFFHNLGTPGRVVSDLVQLKGREAAIEVGSFMINSTWGVLGFGDLFAGNCEAQTSDSDLGLAMAHHGVGTGAYVVWPFIGSYTVRDSVGWLGGLLLDPVSFIHPLQASLGVRSYDMVNYTSFRIGDYESLKDAAIDPYLATRDAYLQYRAKKVRE